MAVPMSRSSLALCLRLRWGVRWCVHVRLGVVHEECVDVLPRRSHCSSNASPQIPMRAPSSSRWLGRSLTRSQSTPSAAHKCSSTALSTSALASFCCATTAAALLSRFVSCPVALQRRPSDCCDAAGRHGSHQSVPPKVRARLRGKHRDVAGGCVRRTPIRWHATRRVVPPPRYETRGLHAACVVLVDWYDWCILSGLEHHTAAAQAQGLCLVSDLRHCKDNLASMGIKVVCTVLNRFLNPGVLTLVCVVVLSLPGRCGAGFGQGHAGWQAACRGRIPAHHNRSCRHESLHGNVRCFRQCVL